MQWEIGECYWLLYKKNESAYYRINGRKWSPVCDGDAKHVWKAVLTMQSTEKAFSDVLSVFSLLKMNLCTFIVVWLHEVTKCRFMDITDFNKHVTHYLSRLFALLEAYVVKMALQNNISNFLWAVYLFCYLWPMWRPVYAARAVVKAWYL